MRRLARGVLFAVAVAALGCVRSSQTPPAAPPQAAVAPDSLAHYRAARADASHHLVIVALGDSNTEVNWTTRGHLNWVGLLAAGLFESEGMAGRYTVINAGKSGDTLAGGLARLQRDVIRHDPDLVIVSYGMNDFRQDTAELSAKNLHTLIARLRKETRASILVRTPQPLYQRDRGDGQWEPNAQLDATVDAIRRVAAQDGVGVVDHFSLWQAPNQIDKPVGLSYDRLHANQFGHRRFYAELAPILELPAAFKWEKRMEDLP